MQIPYQLGATLLTLAPGMSHIFKAPSGCAGYYLKNTNGATLSLIQQGGQSHTLGYPISNTDAAFLVNGPAQFIMACGTTALVGQVILYSAGYSQQP